MAAGASAEKQAVRPAEAVQAQPPAKRKREESFAWDNSALEAGGDPLCFEEVKTLLPRPPLLALHVPFKSNDGQGHNNYQS